MNGIKGIKIGGLKATAPPKIPGVVSPSLGNTANPSQVGSQAVVKTPKAKQMGQATDKPSVFFKSENFVGIKQASIENLRSFLERQREKRKT